MSFRLHEDYFLWDLRPPADFERRGFKPSFAERDALPYYPYRHDGLQIWEIYVEWVSKVVDEELWRSEPVQQWVEMLIDKKNYVFRSLNEELGDDYTPREQVVLHSFRCNATQCGSLTNFRELVALMIWLPTAFHAAVNYAMFDGSFNAFMPSALYTSVSDPLLGMAPGQACQGSGEGSGECRQGDERYGKPSNGTLLELQKALMYRRGAAKDSQATCETQSVFQLPFNPSFSWRDIQDSMPSWEEQAIGVMFNAFFACENMPPMHIYQNQHDWYVQRRAVEGIVAEQELRAYPNFEHFQAQNENAYPYLLPTELPISTAI